MNKFRKIKFFIRNQDGIAAVEFAIIVPFFMLAMFVAASLGFSVSMHQKLQESANASMGYLQDMVAEKELSELLVEVKDENGEKQDNPLVQTMKLVFQDAFGNTIDLSSMNIAFDCKCPILVDTDEQGEALPDPYYDFSSLGEAKAVSGNSQVCPAKCGETGTEDARIYAKLDIDYAFTDLMGRKKLINKSITSRIK